jgi:general secretion pathway protein E
VMWAGVLVIPVVLVALVAEMFFFVKQRDKRVPPASRILTKQALANARAYLKARSAKNKLDAADKKAAAGPPKSILQRLSGITAAIGRKKPPPKPAAATGPHFALLKKDGSPAVNTAAEEEGEGGNLSENIVNVRKMLIDAMQRGATDLHFEPVENKGYHVRLRVDGVLQDAKMLETTAGRGVISALKVVADMDIAERRRPQDGTFSAVFGESKYDVRAAATPTSYGEKMVLRLLQSSGGIMKQGLGSIGLRQQILDPLRDVIHKPYGMFLVTGPTGSGKTTTVYASLSEIDAKQHNITTIEDPVEYRLDGITQIAVNTAAGVTFASILRSVLRQDPDVLLVGEIRDKETAEIACQAALTGHFVFSTLHANDTVATVTRMLDLGLDPMLIQTAVTAVLAQRLARRVCIKCRQPNPPPPDLLKRMGLKPEMVKVIYTEKGCPECGGSGYKGRMGLHELLLMNDGIRGLITASPNIQELKVAAKKAGVVPLQMDGILKVLKGATTMSEVVRVTT